MLAVSGVPTLTDVTAVERVSALLGDAVADVTRELAVAGVCGDVSSAELELAMLLDASVVADDSVTPVAVVVADAEVAEAADGVLDASVSVTTDAVAVLDCASALEVTALADDASLLVADAVGDAGVVGTMDADDAGVAGVAAVAAEPVEAAPSIVPVLDFVAVVPTDIAVPADVSRLETSVTFVTTLQADGVTVTSFDDGLALDTAVDVVSENNNIVQS